MQRSTRHLLIAALFGSALSAHAQLFYSNYAAGDLSTGSGYAIAGGGSLGFYFEQGFSFTSAASGQLGQITISLFYVTGTNSSNVILWSDSGGLPGTALGTWTLNSLPPNQNNGVGTTFNITGGPSLTSGSVYWLTAQAPSGTETAWDQTTSGATGVRALRSVAGGTWTNEGTATQGGFRLEAVPEPMSCIALGAGVLLALKRRRRV